MPEWIRELIIVGLGDHVLLERVSRLIHLVSRLWGRGVARRSSFQLSKGYASLICTLPTPTQKGHSGTAELSCQCLTEAPFNPYSWDPTLD